MFRSIIFDLDGTLIDSRAAILDAFGKALAARGIEPRIPWSAVRIGPPLTETLRELIGDRDETLLDALAEQFKAHYDTSGYRASEVFAGVQELLDALTATGAHCFLATNKRIAPTRLILSHLQWEQHFRDVYALEVLSAVLSADENGRFTREIVRGSRIANQAGAGYDMTSRGPTLFLLSGVPAQGKTTTDVEVAMLAQIARIGREGVTADELRRVKTQYVAGQIYSRDSVMAQAQELAGLEMVGMAL